MGDSGTLLSALRKDQLVGMVSAARKHNLSGTAGSWNDYVKVRAPVQRWGRGERVALAPRKETHSSCTSLQSPSVTCVCALCLFFCRPTAPSSS